MNPDSSFPDEIDEDARRRFERAWRDGAPVPIEEVLPPANDARHLGTLEELIAIELEFAWRDQDRGPRLEDYRARFETLVDPALLLRLLREEYRVRHLHGDAPSVTEYERRFPELVPTGREIGEPVAIHDPDAGRLPTIPGYDIESVLGRGGMGVVYGAIDASLNRRVALKMLLAGRDANENELARFHREAEAVALLQHPNIVEIHSVGEHEGRPYFALEYVDGGNLAQRLDAKPPTSEECARMIEMLARALQCAHDAGVVHRDLKPANVLLTRDGTPKISDFGVAKSLESTDDLRTRTGDVIGTPAYMAPEQAAGHGKDVGPAADVYALGAILYRALTGRPPFHADTHWNTVQQVVADEPIAPGRLRARLPRDLETITLKCLEKDPSRRYASCTELAADLARYVAGQPIHARPASVWYRAAKWVRRKPMTAALVLVSSIGTATLLGGSLYYNQQLEDSLDLANLNLQDAREAVDRMLSRVAQTKLAQLPQSERVVELLLADALAFYERFLARHPNDPVVRRETARAHRRLGDIRKQLGKTEASEEDYQTALAALESLTSERPEDYEAWLELAATCNNHGHLLRAVQKRDAAETAYRRAVSIAERIEEKLPTDPRVLRALAEHRHNLASFLIQDVAEAERLFVASIATADELVTAHPEELVYRQQLKRSLHDLGLMLRNDKRPAEAVAPLTRAVKLEQQIAQAAPHDPRVRAGLAETYNTLGILHWDLDDLEAAQRHYDIALDVRRALARDFPSTPDYQSGLAATLHNSGELLLEREQLQAAAEKFDEAIRHQVTAYRANPREPQYIHQLYNHHWALGETLVELGQHGRASKVITQLPKIKSRSWNANHLASKMLCHCMRAAGRDETLDEATRDNTLRRYADLALAELDAAVGKGLKDRAQIDNEEFDPLRPRAEFDALLARLE